LPFDSSSDMEVEEPVAGYSSKSNTASLNRTTHSVSQTTSHTASHTTSHTVSQQVQSKPASSSTARSVSILSNSSVVVKPSPATPVLNCQRSGHKDAFKWNVADVVHFLETNSHNSFVESFIQEVSMRSGIITQKVLLCFMVRSQRYNVFLVSFIAWEVHFFSFTLLYFFFVDEQRYWGTLLRNVFSLTSLFHLCFERQFYDSLDPSRHWYHLLLDLCHLSFFTCIFYYYFLNRKSMDQSYWHWLMKNSCLSRTTNWVLLSSSSPSSHPWSSSPSNITWGNEVEKTDLIRRREEKRREAKRMKSNYK